MKNKNDTFNIGDFVMLRRVHRNDPFAYGTIFGIKEDEFKRPVYHIEWNDNHKPSMEYATSLIWVA